MICISLGLMLAGYLAFKHTEQLKLVGAGIGVVGVVLLVVVMRMGEAKADAETDEFAAEQAVKHAKEMGVSLEAYKLGAAHEVAAHVHCQDATKAMAAWTASANVLPDYSWKIVGRTIHVTGSDLKMTNGFGGEQTVTYNCRYDIDSERAEITSAG